MGLAAIDALNSLLVDLKASDAKPGFGKSRGERQTNVPQPDHGDASTPGLDVGPKCAGDREHYRSRDSILFEQRDGHHHLQTTHG
jgi:hypothetical protein